MLDGFKKLNFLAAILGEERRLFSKGEALDKLIQLAIKDLDLFQINPGGLQRLPLLFYILKVLEQTQGNPFLNFICKATVAFEVKV